MEFDVLYAGKVLEEKRFKVIPKGVSDQEVFRDYSYYHARSPSCMASQLALRSLVSRVTGSSPVAGSISGDSLYLCLSKKIAVP